VLSKHDVLAFLRRMVGQDEVRLHQLADVIAWVQAAREPKQTVVD
jgi:hypothetical protein